MKGAILSVRNLRVHLRSQEGIVKALEDVSFHLLKKETLAIVGESGSGKSTLAHSILRLIPDPPLLLQGGEVRFHGKDLLKFDAASMRKIRGSKISMIFQDPLASLNPYLTVGTQLTEVLEVHERMSRDEARKQATEWLERVGIDEAGTRMNQYPHQFSGGMRQRAMIAMALLCKPEVIIADEPTSALDVATQSQVLSLLKELKAQMGLSMILITHDLGVAAQIADRVHVLYAGRIVENARTGSLFSRPRHPYTLGLLKSVPRIDQAKKKLLDVIPGSPPHLAHLPEGCAFQTRCGWVQERCRTDLPGLEKVAPSHESACWESKQL